jgi:hypothetical protein
MHADDDTMPPPVMSNMPADDLRGALQAELRLGMQRPEALRAIRRLRLEPTPAIAIWIARDSDGRREPYPLYPGESTALVVEGWRVVERPPIEPQSLPDTEAHFLIRDWYPRPANTICVRADWNRRLLILRFQPDGTLARIDVGAAIGMSGTIHGDGFSLSDSKN